MNTRTIFFVGKPGCGKGTQAKLLSEKIGWPVFSSGKMFREIATESTPVGLKVKKEMESGLLSPHWFAMYLYEKTLFALPEGGNAIFDGFNRKVTEAELIVDSLHWLGRPFSVINIIVSDDSIRARLEKRKEIEGRADDNVVEERLKEYELHTVPAIEIFRKDGVLIEVDGERTPDEIAEEIKEKLAFA
jgi:adenylate kinase